MGESEEIMDWTMFGRVVVVLLQGYSVLMLGLIFIIAMSRAEYRRMWFQFFAILVVPMMVMIANGDWHVRGM